MGTIQSGLEYLVKKHEEAKTDRMARRQAAAARREEERLRREAERRELLARLTERFRKQFGWDMTIIDYGHDDWGDPVYRLDNDMYITITERSPLSYKKKPMEDPFKDVRQDLQLNRFRDDILNELRNIRIETKKPDEDEKS